MIKVVSCALRPWTIFQFYWRLYLQHQEHDQIFGSLCPIHEMLFHHCSVWFIYLNAHWSFYFIVFHRSHLSWQGLLNVPIQSNNKPDANHEQPEKGSYKAGKWAKVYYILQEPLYFCCVLTYVSDLHLCGYFLTPKKHLFDKKIN